MILHGDCLEKLKSLADNSVDSIVTDPPYGLSFMNKKWDHDVPSQVIWEECLRVLKPGSGSTGVAAIKCGFSFIGIEREADYVEIAKKRIEVQEITQTVPAVLKVTNV